MSTPNIHPGRQAAKRAGAKTQATVSGVPAKPNSSATQNFTLVNGEQREAMIRKAAYFRSASRGFCPGQEVDDWLAAEAEVDCMLAKGELPTLYSD